MKIKLLILFSLISNCCYATEAYLSALDFVKQYTDGFESRYTYVLSEESSRLIVGAIYPITNTDTKGGVLFILIKNQAGMYRLSETSEQNGPLSINGKTYIETIKTSKDSFQIQYNIRSACGVMVNRYKFKKVNETWRVAESDSTYTLCLRDGSIGTSKQISQNFLSGQIRYSDYTKNRRKTSRVEIKKFPALQFKDFIPFDNKLGEKI